jgi:AmmeMemoRadiSam system protein B
MKNNDVIPAIREDLSVDTTNIDGITHIVLTDEIGFAKEPAVFGEILLLILQQIDGNISLEDLHKWVLENINSNLPLEAIKTPIEELIERGFFQTEDYFTYKEKFFTELNSGNIRFPICAGSSYSEDKTLLENELEALLSTPFEDGYPQNAKAIIAPHIDFKVGQEAHKVYASAYHAIAKSNPDIVIVLGTCHRYSNAHFMLSNKNYLTPFGEAKTDKSIVEYLLKDTPENIAKIDEMAHLTEHSVEFQIVLLQKMFQDRDISFVPIVTGSLHDYIAVNGKPTTNLALMSFIEKLNNVEAVFGKKVLIVTSVDFAHIGRKFGDDYNAEFYLDTVREEDGKLLEFISMGKSDDFLSKISHDQDKWKVCGTSPIYLTMLTLNNAKGKILNYGQWNETETLSAVTFASVAFYEEDKNA